MNEHIGNYVREMRNALAESGTTRLNIERCDGWLIWAEGGDCSLPAPGGPLFVDDCQDVVEALTGWSPEQTAKFLHKVDKEGKQTFEVTTTGR